MTANNQHLQHLARIPLAAALILAASPASACSNHTKPIAVGGVDGFASLANPANTAILRSSCKVSLYIHGYIWTRLKKGSNIRHKILKVFKGTGPAMVELGASPNTAAFFGTYYEQNFRARGVIAHIATINGADGLTLPQWKNYVTAGKSEGLKIIAPDFAPNVDQDWHNGTIDRHLWNQNKRRALIGGALAIDAPPSFFFWYTPNYRHFIVHEIQWANQNHLRSILIISPNTARRRFLSDTQQMIAYLTRQNANPTNYVVENYESLPWPKSFINLVGSETSRYSITGVALWLTTLFPKQTN
ncbi:MAG: hypothetical protein PHT60_08455 [Acidiphilium sp.]|nr:hypothetical protein [Acidiphilium sp.]MDD4935794.1 hypothetical protein [Acidiphilium sp.]